MIHEILPSDVEFARAMVNSSRLDAEILTYLTSRGIAPDKAAHLLDDLRHGRKPDVQAQFALGSTTRHTAPKPETPTRVAPPPEVSVSPHSRHRKRKRSGEVWWVAIMVIIFLWAVWYAFVRSGADASKELIDMDKHAIPDAPNKEAGR